MGAKPLPNIVEERRVRRVAREIDTRVICRQHEPSPECAVAVERAAGRKVMRRRERDRHTR